MLVAVIAVTEAVVRRSQVVDMLATAGVVSFANTSLALVAAMLVSAEPWALIPLSAVVVVLFAAYRAYVGERAQRERVEFLYSSTRALRDNPETSAAASGLLEEAAAMFRASRAELRLFDRPEDPGTGVVFTLVGGAIEARAVETDDAVRDLAGAASPPVLVSPGAPFMQNLDLAGITGLRDAMVGTLEGGDRPLGVLVVGDRLGNVTSFTADDVRLFETLVQQAAVALENDHLEQALRELRRLEQDLEHQATHDTLTGLANRSLFGARLDEAMAGNQPVTALYIDLDDFKVVNDTLGHESGDHVLMEVSRRILSVVRPADTAARLGGDEFAVVLTESRQPDLVARRIIRSLHEPILLGEHDVQVGASIGLATSQDGMSAAELLNDADTAMYAAKSQGKGAVVTFRPAMRAEVSQRRRMRTQLRHAIDHDEFTVAYQPIVDLAQGAPAGAEALVRWNAPDGLLMPGTFIDEAERAGFVVSIDRNVLDKVVDGLSMLPEPQPEDAEPLFVSVNLSARNFQEEDLVDHFARTLLRADAVPATLVVEITETALLQDPDRTVTQLQELRELGLRVALDDFGTGYSSLSYLRKLPVDILKIAQPFVADVESDVTFVKAMVDLGRNLGLTILAEGIETRAQWDVLRDLGCHLGQGYYFGRPMEHAEVLEQLSATHVRR